MFTLERFKFKRCVLRLWECIAQFENMKPKLCFSTSFFLNGNATQLLLPSGDPSGKYKKY